MPSPSLSLLVAGTQTGVAVGVGVGTGVGVGVGVAVGDAVGVGEGVGDGVGVGLGVGVGVGVGVAVGVGVGDAVGVGVAVGEAEAVGVIVTAPHGAPTEMRPPRIDSIGNIAALESRRFGVSSPSITSVRIRVVSPGASASNVNRARVPLPDG
jgi:hypothetical protein